MDLHFQYSDNTSPNFAGLFARAYERITDRGDDKKATASDAPDSSSKPNEEPKPQPATWNPVSRSRKANESHAQQAKTSAESVQTYTGKATRATDGRARARVASAPSTPRQFDPSRVSRRALPYQGEGPVTPGQGSKMGKHAKPQNPSEVLGRHASGPPPAYETKPVRPGHMGRHAR